MKKIKGAVGLLSAVAILALTVVGTRASHKPTWVEKMTSGNEIASVDCATFVGLIPALLALREPIDQRNVPVRYGGHVLFGMAIARRDMGNAVANGLWEIAHDPNYKDRGYPDLLVPIVDELKAAPQGFTDNFETVRTRLAVQDEIYQGVVDDLFDSGLANCASE